MFSKMIEVLKNDNRKLVFTEGSDSRILGAASRLVKEGLLTPILLGDKVEIEAAAKNQDVDLAGMELYDPAKFGGIEVMIERMYELRKGKQDFEQCKNALRQPNYFGTMMVQMGMADGLLGGATYSTADAIRPALQLIKTKPTNKIVSSFFILKREVNGSNEMYAMGDCAINLFPDEDEIMEIAVETAKGVKQFGIEPKVALLSYSTMGLGKGESPTKMRRAAERLNTQDIDFDVDGELQFDAAFVPEVGQIKAPESKVAGQANTFIFPDINTGNIAYKMAQRLGGFEAIGPMLRGLNAPINDLSRGCSEDEVYKMAIITAVIQ
ncbi:MAG: phosphate acetyltransferase [Suipraeoptans sp.]